MYAQLNFLVVTKPEVEGKYGVNSANWKDFG